MNAKYRLVHFLPDPFSGAQVPVAALVGGEGGVVVTRADHLPGAACLGSPERESALECVLESIIDARTLDGLPVGAGPQAVLGPLMSVPAGVNDAAHWVRQHILPQGTPTGQLLEHRSPKRQTRGFGFLEKWNVGRLVHKRFHPEREWTNVFPRPIPALQPVSHWSGNPESTLLLMEPIIPERLQRSDDIKLVFSRLAGYRVFLSTDSQGLAQRTNLCVYVLPGAPESRSSVLGAFDGLGARVVDTEDDDQRDAFLTEIRAIGGMPPGQAPLSQSGLH